MMEATRHANAMELETLRHEFEMDLRDAKKVDSAGISDDEWSEDEDDEDLYEIDDDDDTSATERALKETRELHEEISKKKMAKPKSKK